MPHNIIWGMSGKGHDASIVVFKNESVVFESYTQDKEHDAAIIEKIKQEHGEPDLVVWYENPWKKMLRQWWRVTRILMMQTTHQSTLNQKTYTANILT